MGRPVLVHGPTERTGIPMALIACPKCNSEDINGTPQPDSRLLIHCNACGTEWLRGEARRDPGRSAVQTIDSLHAEFPTALSVRHEIRERVATLEAEFLLHRPEPDQQREEPPRAQRHVHRERHRHQRQPTGAEQHAAQRHELGAGAGRRRQHVRTGPGEHGQAVADGP